MIRSADSDEDVSTASNSENTTPYTQDNLEKPNDM